MSKRKPSIWLVIPFYDHEGYGIPYGYFSTEKAAEAYAKKCRDPSGHTKVEVLEIQYGENPDYEAT